MGQVNNRVEVYKFYEKKMNRIIEYYRTNSEEFRTIQKSLGEKYQKYNPLYNFSEFCSWMNELKRKTGYLLKGFEDESIKEETEIIDYLYEIADKELKLREWNENKIGEKVEIGLTKILSVLQTYQTYLDFLYTKYKLKIDMRLKYKNKTVLNLDNIDVKEIDKRIFNYIDELKNGLIKADKENNNSEKARLAKIYDEVCDIFEEVYQDYCEEKARRGVPRPRHKEEKIETRTVKVQEKKIEDDGSITIYGYEKEVPVSELDKLEEENKKNADVEKEKETDIVKIEKEEPKFPTNKEIAMKQILDDSIMSSWTLLTNLVNNLPYEKKLITINKLIQTVSEVK